MALISSPRCKAIVAIARVPEIATVAQTTTLPGLLISGALRNCLPAELARVPKRGLHLSSGQANLAVPQCGGLPADTREPKQDIRFRGPRESPDPRRKKEGGA